MARNSKTARRHRAPALDHRPLPHRVLGPVLPAFVLRSASGGDSSANIIPTPYPDPTPIYRG